LNAGKDRAETEEQERLDANEHEPPDDEAK